MSDFSGLLVSKPQRAVVLRFHQLDHMREDRLPFGRLGQHAVEDFFQFGFGHWLKDTIPAVQLRARLK